MGVLLGEGRYQTLQNLHSESGYSASVCIDIETKNDYRPLIFNTYSDPKLISAFLPLYYGLSKDICGDFHRLISGDGCFMAVFDYHRGIPFEAYLNSLQKSDYEARAKAIGLLLDAAIPLDALPPAFAVAVLTDSNTVFVPKDREIHFNFIIKPHLLAQTEKIEAMAAHLENAFVKNRYFPELITGFLEKASLLESFVEICAAWRHSSPAAMKQYEEYLSEPFFKYAKRMLKSKFRR